MTSLAIALFVALAQAGAPPAAEATPPTAAPAAEAAPSPAPVAEPAAEPAAAPTSAPKKSWVESVQLSGFARIGVFYAFPLRQDDLVGSNGGFRMADFRLNADFRPVDRLLASTSVELAAPVVDPTDPQAGRRVVDLRDAFLQYDVCSGAVVRAGQFRPPYYAEMLLSDGAVPFVGRSVLASGIAPPEGYGPRIALAPERQVGVQLGSRRLGSTLGLKYAVGVFNGNGLNQLFNDNNNVNPVARVEVDWDKKVTVGVNGAYNQLTSGPRTARLYTNSLSYGADVTAKVWRLDVMAGFLGKSSTFSFAGLPAESSMGAMGMVHYASAKRGLEAALRVAWYEPSSAMPDDAVTELAAMIGWQPFELPFRLLLQYTHREEEARVSIPNDSVDVMIHARW